MNALISRPAELAGWIETGESDLRRVYAFVAACPEACPHTIDLPWELTSPWAQEDDATHRAAFDSTAMSADWRRRVLHDPLYVPELDLAAMAPDGRLAAFCICWIRQFGEGRIVSQVEPMGVHPDFQGLGLGRAVLAAALRKLQAQGATSVEIEYVDWNERARRLYEWVGFKAQYSVLAFQRFV